MPKPLPTPKIRVKPQEVIIKAISGRMGEESLKETQKELNIFDKTPTTLISPSGRLGRKAKKKIKKKTPSEKKNEKFFNKVKETLAKNSIELSDIEAFSKNELTLRVKYKGAEHLLVAYNKKRINENDIIKAHKKATETGLPYMIFSLGEPSKKLLNFIKAIKNLAGVEKIG